MTKSDRNKRYNKKHADTLALKRKRVQEEKSEDQRQQDRAADRERKRRKKVNQTPTEKAAQLQKDAESYRRRSAALTDEQRSVVLQRMRATEKRLRLAKQIQAVLPRQGSTLQRRQPAERQLQTAGRSWVRDLAQSCRWACV
jgi:hypothetical protein